MAGVPGAGLHALPAAVGLRAGDDAEQAPEDAVDARGPRLDVRVPVLVDGDRELGAVGGGGEGGRRGRVERVPGVGEQQRAQRLADGDRAREVVVRERLARVGEPVLREPLRQLAGNGERLVAVFEVNGVHEGLDQGQLVGWGLRHNYLSSIDGDIITGVSAKPVTTHGRNPMHPLLAASLINSVSNDRARAPKRRRSAKVAKAAAGYSRAQRGHHQTRQCHRCARARPPRRARQRPPRRPAARRGRRRGRRDRRRGRR